MRPPAASDSLEKKANPMKLRLHGFFVTLVFALLAGCASPTVNIATQKPIEIKIDLRHEVRIQLDRDVSELIESEGVQALTARSAAQDADRIREGLREGRLGEGADGYLAARDAGATSDTTLVDRVNASRRAGYEALALESGRDRTDVEAIAGAQRIREAADGEWIRTPNGEWVRKDATTRIVVTDDRDA